MWEIPKERGTVDTGIKPVRQIKTLMALTSAHQGYLPPRKAINRLLYTESHALFFSLSSYVRLKTSLRVFFFSPFSRKPVSTSTFLSIPFSLVLSTLARPLLVSPCPSQSYKISSLWSHHCQDTLPSASTVFSLWWRASSYQNQSCAPLLLGLVLLCQTLPLPTRSRAGTWIHGPHLA